MEFRILGSFEVVGSTGFIDLRGAKRRGVLAFLVVHAGHPVSIDRLVEELWGDARSDGAARTVQTYVSQLRKLLKGEAASLQTRPGGYALEVDPREVDAYRFEQGVTAASAEPDAAQRLAKIDEALVLWRGPPLGEFAGADWADREATRLDALDLQAQQCRYDALMELGRAREAVAELELLVAARPLDETLRAQFMLVLYRSGRQADALATYQQARRQLVDELGIEPGPELAELEHRILEHDPTIAATDRTGSGGTQPVSARGIDSWYPRTFLLTDIVDSVSLWERDPAAMSHVVARHDAIIEDAVGGFGGVLVRTKGEGDSTFSVFSHPWDAVAAASAVQEVIGSEPWRSTAPVRVRVGVHTGDAEPREGDWYGPAVNRAARLRALADGRQTLVSGVTAGLVADRMPNDVRLLYRGRRVLRGIERPEEVWELVAADDARLTPGPARVGRLPLALTRFVGRSGDVERLVELIGNERLVTLTGPGGSGKTRLAMEVSRDAERRGEVVWLAELASLRDGRLVPEAVAAAVGVEAGPDPLDDLLAQSSALNGLLVLDNCEHLLDACAALIERLLAAAPDIRILTTSREPLGLPGQQEWPVRPLAVPDVSQLDREQLVQVESVQLLLDRAHAVRPDLEVGDDVTPIVSICRALDGIPLAIELAAGRLRSLSLPDLAARLDDQLTVLASHRSAALDDSRHQTLRTTLDWSYNLLTDQQQTLARRLSVFAGGFRLDAVDAVCGSSQMDVLDGVDELVAKSLVTFDGATARYRLLEPLRQYLAERLEDTGATQTVQKAHAEWVGDLCDRLGTGLLVNQRACSIRLGEEAGNIELALCWAYDHDPSLAVWIVGSLGLYWFTYDQASGRRWCEAVIDASTGVAPRSRATALLSAGMVAQNDAAWNPAIGWLREALAIYRVEDESLGEAASLYFLGRALDNRWRLEDHDERDAAEAVDCFERGLRLFTQLGVWIGAAWCQILLTLRALDEQDLDRAETLSRQVIEQCNTAGIRHPVGQAFRDLATIAHQRGHRDTAAEFLENAVAVYRDLNDPWQLAGALVDLAAQAAITGRQDEALQALAESTRLDEQIGKLPGRAYVFGMAAVVHLARGQTNLATLALGAFDAHPMRGTLGTLQVEAVDETRARLDATEVAAASAAAHDRSIDDLIDELIIQPARVAGSPVR